MGKICTCFEFHNENLKDSNELIIYCNEGELNIETQRLNIKVAEKLIDKSHHQRALFMQKYLLEILDDMDDDILISDFDVLFNPMLKIDVLKMFLELSKIKPFSIRWPGRIEDDCLIYSEECFEDYKRFRIDDYDIICVK